MIHHLAEWLLKKPRPRTLKHLRLESTTAVEWLESRQLLSATTSQPADVSTAAVDVPLGLDLPGDPLDAALVRDNTPVQIDPGAVVEDVDTDVDYANAKIHVSIVEGGVYDDYKHNRVVLGVINEGAGAGQVEVKGKRIFFDNGTDPIATFTGGKSLKPLAITFSADATEDAVNAVLAQLSITAKRNASVGPRAISVSVTADGQTATGTQTATIYSGESVDESIKVALPNDPADAEIGGDAVQIDADAAVEDSASGADFSKAQVRVTITGGAGDDDDANDRVVLAVIDQGAGAGLVEVKGKKIFFDNGTEPIATFKGGHFGKTLTIFFTGADIDIVNAVMAQIGIQATQEAAEGERRVDFEVTAGDAVAINRTSVNVVQP